MSYAEVGGGGCIELDSNEPMVDGWPADCRRLLAGRIDPHLARDYGFAGGCEIPVRRYVERARPAGITRVRMSCS